MSYLRKTLFDKTEGVPIKVDEKLWYQELSRKSIDRQGIKSEKEIDCTYKCAIITS